MEHNILKTKTLLVLTIVLGMILVACTGASDSSIALSQSIESGNDDGVLTVNYPDGWFAESQGDAAVIITNEEALLATGDAGSPPVLEAGQAVLIVSVVNGEDFSFFLEEGEELTSTRFVEIFSTIMGNEESSETIAEEITIDGESAAIATMVSEGQGITIISKELDNNFLLLLAITPLEEQEENQDLFKSIISSASYAPAGD